MEERFRVAQKAVITDQTGKVLVVRFSSHPMIPQSIQGKWDLPGGGLDHESLSTGLLREIKEELGEVDVVVGKPINVYMFALEDREQNCVAIVYSAQMKSGNIVLSEEHDKYAWVSIKEANSLDFANDEMKESVLAAAHKGGQ